MTRAELIAALRAATGPSRELDDAILCATYPDLDPRNDMGDWHTADGTHIRVEDYTGSIDAALTLVPSNYFWSVTMRGSNRGGGFDACCLPEDGHMKWHTGATPAITICIAALLATQESDNAGS